ncbi:MAG: hypothetical protein LPK79_10105, partial [Bacteroidota bacterium]|nr:hypothetical protein [Bacteroidota bacterium]
TNKVKPDKFKIAFKKWFDHLDETPPKETWDGIEDQLDLDDVWSRLESKLDSTPSLSPAPTPKFWKPVLFAGILFLLTIPTDTQDDFLPFQTYVPRLTQSGPEIQPENSIGSEGDEQIPANDNLGVVLEEVNNKVKVPFQRIQKTSGQENSHMTVNKSSSSIAGKGDLEPNTSEDLNAAISNLNQPMTGSGDRLENQEFDPIIIDPLTEGTTVRSQSFATVDLKPKGYGSLYPQPALQLIGLGDHDGYVLSENGKYSGPRLHSLGLTDAFKNTWLLNNETYSGWQSETYMETQTSFGWDIGLSSRWAWGSQRFDLELYGFSTTAQGYNKYVNARYVEERIQLRYLKAQFLYRIPVLSSHQDLSIGLYGARLQEATRTLGENIEDVTSTYQNWDYGLLAGYQRNIALTRNIFIHPGIRLSYGLTNIFKGSDSLPAHLRRTHQAAASFQLGLSYKF